MVLAWMASTSCTSLDWAGSLYGLQSIRSRWELMRHLRKELRSR